jgi:hypothetical protein
LDVSGASGEGVMDKIEVKFEKSNWLPINVIAVKSNFDFTVSFFCLNCKEKIGTLGMDDLMYDAYPNFNKLVPHKCKEEKDGNKKEDN